MCSQVGMRTCGHDRNVIYMALHSVVKIPNEINVDRKEWKHDSLMLEVAEANMFVSKHLSM